MSFKEKRARGTPDFPLQLYSVDKNHPRYKMVCHWHVEFELLYITRGVLHIRLDDRKYTASEGDIAFINAGVLHSAVPQGDSCEYECVVFNMGYLFAHNDICGPFVKNVMNRGVFVEEYLPARDDTLHRTANELVCEIKNASYGHQLTVKGLLYIMIGIIYGDRLYRNNESQKNGSEQKIARLKDVIDLIEESYDTDITLGMMAERAKLTPKYFCAYFKEITDMSPVEYLISYRIGQACAMLENSSLPVTEISYNCGFNDLSYFIRTFKKQKNTTPGRFRKKLGT